MRGLALACPLIIFERLYLNGGYRDNKCFVFHRRSYETVAISLNGKLSVHVVVYLA